MSALTVRSDALDGVTTIRLDGELDISTAPDLERFARRHRADLLAALFPGLRADDDTVTIPLRPQA